MSIPIFFPLPKTRKAAKITMIIFIAVCIAVIAVIYSFWARDQKTLEEKGQPDFNMLSHTELEDGLIVKGGIVFAFDMFAETYEENFGMRTSEDSEDLYYVIPIIGENGDGSIECCIAFRARPSDFDKMEEILYQTYMEPDTITTLSIKNGVINNLRGDFLTYYHEWMEMPDFYEGGSFIDMCAEENIFGTTDKDEIRSRIAPFVLSKTAAAGVDINAAWFFAAIGGLCLICLLVLIFRKKPIKSLDPPVEKGFDQLKDDDTNDTL